jgi:Ala-tRNA(Pro) deacylase
MPLNTLKGFLDENRIPYVSIKHSTAYTAQAIAASAHIKGKNLAKTVIVKLDGVMAMAVLPAKYKVDLEQLKKAAKSKKAGLAGEQEFVEKFPDCEDGAMPPFGNLYDMKVFVDKTLSDDEEIAFNACSHSELIQLKYKDFERLAKPVLAHFHA